MVIGALQLGHRRRQGFLAAHILGDQVRGRRRGDRRLGLGAGKCGFKLGSRDFARAQFTAEIGIEIAQTKVFNRSGVGDFGNSTVEGGFKISEGDFARAQLAAEVSVPVVRNLRGFLCDLLGQSAHRGIFEATDQLGVVTGRFDTGMLQRFEHDLDLVNGLQDEGDHGRADAQFAIPELAKQRFASVRHRFQSRQTEEAAGREWPGLPDYSQNAPVQSL